MIDDPTLPQQDPLHAADAPMNERQHPPSFVEFMQNSPLADALAAGEISPDAFDREPDRPRNFDASDEPASE